MSNRLETPEFREAYRAFRRGEAVSSVLDPHVRELFAYRMEVREELNARGKFWISPDIATDMDVIIPPNRTAKYVDIRLEPDKLSPFTEYNPYAVSCAYETTRSRFAQLGLEVIEGSSAEIARTFYWTQEEDGSKRYGAAVPVVNYAARPIFLPRGTRFFYLYYWDWKTIQGEELVDLVGKEIGLSGEEGKEWKWSYWPRFEGQVEGINGIELLIDEESQQWVPSGNEPMSISDGSIENHNRAGVDAYLAKPIPKVEKPILWIAETQSEVNLKEGVNGIVGRFIPRSESEPEYFEFQTNALLLQGGNTYGKMRTEIYSATTPDLIPKSSFVRFARA